MAENNDSQVKSCQNDGISKTKAGRLESFEYKNGDLQIVVDCELPQSLIAANIAVKAKKIDIAKVK